jgi:hypothetical protein
VSSFLLAFQARLIPSSQARYLTSPLFTFPLRTSTLVGDPTKAHNSFGKVSLLLPLISLIFLDFLWEPNGSFRFDLCRNPRVVKATDLGECSNGFDLGFVMMKEILGF